VTLTRPYPDLPWKVLGGGGGVGIHRKVMDNEEKEQDKHASEFK
jgi:hypothetical protein